MGKQTLTQKIKEIIAGIAFNIFCWGIGMSTEEYITAISNEAIRGYLEAEAEANGGMG